MKRLLIAFTAAAAFAGPLAASAQDHGHEGRGGGQAPAAAPAAPAAPAAQAPNTGRGGGGWQGRGQGGGQAGGFQGGGRYGRGGQGQAPQAQAPQAQAQPQARGQFQGQGGRRPDAQYRGGAGQAAEGFRNDNRGGGQRFNDNRFAEQRQFDQGRGGYRNGQRYADNRGGYSRYRAQPFRWPAGYGYRRWGLNEYLPRIFLGGGYFIGDYYDIGLGYPPPGEQWVRVGNDALLVDIYSGQIIDVVRDVFYW